MTKQTVYLIGMAKSIDFNTRVLGHSSDRVLGYSDVFFFYQHCTFRAFSFINREARKLPLERNRAADFHVSRPLINRIYANFNFWQLNVVSGIMI